MVDEQRLLAGLDGNGDKARAVHDTGWEYRKSGNYGKADELDRYVIERWPKDVQAMWSRMDMAKTDIWLGNYDSADKAIDTLIADFNDQPELPTAISLLGEQYHKQALRYQSEGREAEAKEYFQKAIVLLERVINELPRSSAIPQSYYSAGRCYESLGEYEYAIYYFKKVIDNWPNFERAWNAQFLIATCLDKLASSGRIEKINAAAQIYGTCEKLLAEYPDCPAVKAAINLIEKWHFIMGREEKANDK